MASKSEQACDTPDETDVHSKSAARDKEGHQTVTEGAVRPGGVATVQCMCIRQRSILTFRADGNKDAGRIRQRYNSSQGFGTLLAALDGASRQTIGQGTADLNNTADQTDPRDTRRAPRPTAPECTWCARAPGRSPGRIACWATKQALTRVRPLKPQLVSLPTTTV